MENFIKSKKYQIKNGERIDYIKIEPEIFKGLTYKQQLDAMPDVIEKKDKPTIYMKKYYCLEKLNPKFKFKTEPYAHQLAGFYKGIREEYGAWFMDMGTGKSKVNIDIVIYKYLLKQIDAVLIIAPNHVHTQWIVEQFPEHCSIIYKSFIWNSGKRTTNIYNYTLEDFITPKMKKLKVFAVNVEAFQSDSIIPTIVDYVKNNTIFTIVDEATRIKTPTAKRSKTIHKLEKYGQRSILTGTPVTKSPFGLWSMYEFLKKNFFECNFFIFQARHGVMMQGVNQQTGGRYKTLIDEKTWAITLGMLKKIKEERGGTLMDDDFDLISGAMALSVKNVKFIEKQQTFRKYKRLDEIKDKIDAITFYAKKEDCLDLPPKVYETVYIEMPKDQRKIYNTLKTQMLVEYEDQTLTVLNKVALTTRLMQICGGFFPYKEVKEWEVGGVEHHIEKVKAKLIGLKNAKLERIKEDLEEMSTFPIILWARFVAELDTIYAELRKTYNCCLYYGQTSANDRLSIIEDFKMNKYDIFIGNTATAGYGLNLQNATTQLTYSNSFNVEERLQGEDRSHRLGVKDTCLYKDYVYKNTIDEKIANAIINGRDMNDFFKTSSLYDIFKEED